MVLSTRQAPVEHAGRRIADVLETVHDVARDEHDRPGTGRRGVAIDGQFIGPFEDEEYFFLVEMDVVGRAFARFVPCHEYRDGAASPPSRWAAKQNLRASGPRRPTVVREPSCLGRIASSEPPPRFYPGSCSQREPKSTEVDDVRKANL